MAFEAGVAERVQGKLSSGIEAFDRVVGGFPPGSVVLIAGKPGSGFDIFSQQILYSAATAGKRVTYLTVDRPPEDVSAEMQELGWNVEELLSGGKWNFLNGFDVRLKVRQGELGEKVLLDMLKGVSKSAMQGDWTAVDTISRVLETYGAQDVMGMIDELLVEAREGRGLHFLILVEELHDAKTIASLAQACDGFMRLSLDETRAEPMGTMRIEKLRRANSVQRSLSYFIGAEGIVIETATRIL